MDKQSADVILDDGSGCRIEANTRYLTQLQEIEIYTIIVATNRDGIQSWE